ncbi:NTP transferase domain-containing protein [Arcobacter sp. LA11]|uniref:NTP transferase domain-containing protein n=1 Tax=Arcobacter sp. LA11 TaxID=1898176 RepID=UPI000934E44D|nr:NTP transferase domain-containing protein [Arcobacter sp. LA11]
MASPSFEIPCVILSGGRSSRMGEDKALLPFSNANSLTEYQYNRLKPYFKNIFVSSKIDKFDFLKNKTKDLILDKGEEYSPIVALETILESINSQKVFIITVDTPLVKIESIKKLIDNSFKYDATVAQTKKTHNLCGVFDKSNLLQIKAMLKNDIHKVGFLLKNINTNYVDFSLENEFINVNEKDDYLKAKALIS